jgi:hypothetical protein
MARALKPPALKAKLPAKIPVKLPAKLPKLPDPNAPDEFEEMTLLEHMEELRDRIVKSVIAIGIAFIAGVFLANPLLNRLLVEANAVDTGFDVVSPTDPITLYFKIALYIAIGIALPVLMWQLIGFLVPGLTKKEKRLLYLSLPFVVMLFLAGAAYGFFFAAPRALTGIYGRHLRVVTRRQRRHHLLPDLDARPGARVPAPGRHVHPGQARRRQPAEDARVPQIRHPHPADPLRDHHAVDRPVQYGDRRGAAPAPLRGRDHRRADLRPQTGGSREGLTGTP